MRNKTQNSVEVDGGMCKQEPKGQNEVCIIWEFPKKRKKKGKCFNKNGVGNEASFIVAIAVTGCDDFIKHLKSRSCRYEVQL